MDDLIPTTSSSTMSAYNDTYSFDYDSAYRDPEKWDEIKTLYTDREIFRYFYHVFSAFIVVSNSLLIVSIFVSKKQRRNFRNWLIIHVTIIHILIGGIICPFLGERFVSRNAGLDTVPCKLLSYLSDTFDYVSNVSIGILGVYQCVVMLSPRMLKGVSRALLTAIMIIVPWVVCVMLTSVLRLTMSEEHLGQCYTISDLTAQMLWNVLAYGLPLFLILVCCIAILIVVCSPFITTIDTVTQSRPNMTVFVSVCLGSCVLMRTPFYFVYSTAIDAKCKEYNNHVICQRLTFSLDQLRLANLVLIPLVYLIPAQIKKCCRKMKSKVLCKHVDCTTHPKKHTLEMVSIKQLDSHTRV